MNLLCLLLMVILCQEIVSNNIKRRDIMTDEYSDSDYTENESNDYSDYESNKDSEGYSSEGSYSDSNDDYSESRNDAVVSESQNNGDVPDSQNNGNVTDSGSKSTDGKEEPKSNDKKEEKSEPKSDAIQNVTADVFDNDKALLRWNKIVSPDIKDRITNFKVKIQQLRKSKNKRCALAGGQDKMSEESIEITVPADKTEAVFSGLEKGTTYEIEVTSYTAKGKGPKSVKIQIQRT